MSVALQVADQTHHVRDTDDSRRVEVGIVVDRKDAMDACSSKLADDDRKSALTLDCDRGRRGLSNQSTNESVQAQRRARLHRVPPPHTSRVSCRISLRKSKIGICRCSSDGLNKKPCARAREREREDDGLSGVSYCTRGSVMTRGTEAARP